MLDVYCFHRFGPLAAFEPELDALNLASRRKDPFSTLAFIRNFAAHADWYPGDRDVEPWFLVAMEDRRVVGYLPLRRSGQKLEFFVTHDADCPQLVARPEREAEVSAAFYRYLFSRADEWQFLELQDQEPGSALTPPPAGLDLGRYYVRTFPAVENNTIPIRWNALDAYVKSLGSSWRRHVRRKTQKLLGAGNVGWLSSADPRATPALLGLIRMVERKSWKSSHAIALGSHPDRLAYVQGLLSPDQPMKLRLSVLTLDGIPVGGSMTGAYGGTTFGLVIVFDNRLEQLSPGVVVKLMMVRSAIADRHAALNLLRGFGYYKQHWLAEPLPTCNGQLYRLGTPAFWRAIAGDFKRRLTPSTSGDPGFNPARRAAPGADQTWAPALAERREANAFVAQLHGFEVERLGPGELNALLPFGERTQPGEARG